MEAMWASAYFGSYDTDMGSFMPFSYSHEEPGWNGLRRIGSPSHYYTQVTWGYDEILAWSIIYWIGYLAFKNIRKKTS